MSLDNEDVILDLGEIGISLDEPTISVSLSGAAHDVDAGALAALSIEIDPLSIEIMLLPWAGAFLPGKTVPWGDIINRPPLGYDDLDAIVEFEISAAKARADEAFARGETLFAEAEQSLADLNGRADALLLDLDAIIAEVTEARGSELTLTARIAAQHQAIIDGDAALASSLTVLDAQVNHVDTGLPAAHARVTAEQTARASADSALAGRADALEATVYDPATGHTATRAWLLSEETARATADSAIVTDLNVLSAQVNHPETGLPHTHARIVTEEQVRAEADSANASSISMLSAQVNHVDTGLPVTRARLVTEEETRATQTGALASRADALEAEVSTARSGEPTLSARLIQIDTARVNGEEAVSTRVTALEAEVGAARQGDPSVSARLTSIDTARATGDSALATQITTVEAAAGSATASGAVRLVAQAGPTGSSAAYGWEITAGPQSVGMQAVVDSGGTARIAFTADKFQVINGAGAGVPVFDLSGSNIALNANVTINGNLIVNGTITGGKIADNTITGGKIAPSTLQYLNFASTIEPVGLVSSLPAVSGYNGPSIIFNITDGRLYKIQGGAWVPVVNTEDIEGQLADAKIASLAASKITGQMTDAQIADLAAAKVVGQFVAAQIADAQITIAKMAAGLRPIEIVSALPGTPHIAGRTVFLTTDNKLYRNTGSGWIASVASSDIAGTLQDAQIAALAASKVTGQLTDAQIQAVAAAKLTGTVSTAQIANAAITNAKLGSLAVDAAKLASNAVTETKIADNAITTPKLTANAVVADKIAAGAVTASKLVIGDTSNMVPDWSQGSLDGWAIQNLQGFALDNSIGDSSGWKLTSNARDNAYGPSDYIQVNPGETYYFSAWVNNADPAAARIMAHTQSPSGTNSWVAVATTNTKNAWVRLEGIYTVPADRTRLRMLLGVDKTSGGPSTQWTKPVMRRASSGELIVDGAIIADKIAANAVTTAKIAASAVTANEIASNAVTAAKISAGAVEAAKIAAGAVQADKIAANAVVADKIASNAVTTAKIAANAVTANEIAAGAVQAAKIAAGAITTEKLAVGFGVNLLSNTSFHQGLDTWRHVDVAPHSSTMALRTPGQSWAGITYPTLRVYQGNNETSGYADVFWRRPGTSVSPAVEEYALPATAGKTYELSVQYSTHRCGGTIFLGFLDANNTTIAWYGTNFVNGNNQSSNDPDTWVRVVRRNVAPAGTRSVRFLIRKNATNSGSNDSWLFIHKPMLCEVPDNATEATPWSEGGVTLINSGAIVTNAVIAEKIAANAVTTAKIAANAVTANEIASNAVTAVKIAANAVEAAKIAAGAVQADKIAANAVVADKIASNAVTSAKIAANSVIAGKIAAGAISTTELAAGSVTTDRLQVGGVDVTRLATFASTNRVAVFSTGSAAYSYWNLVSVANVVAGMTILFSAHHSSHLYDIQLVAPGGVTRYGTSTPNPNGAQIFMHHCDTNGTYTLQARANDSSGGGGGGILGVVIVVQR